MTKQRGAVAPWHPLGWMAAVVRARWNDLLSQPVSAEGDERDGRRDGEPEDRRA